MTANGWLQIAIYALLVAAITVPLGAYMTRVFAGERTFLTPALHYGVAVFEGIRCYRTSRGPAVFRLREHIDRLFDSAHVLGFRELPFTREQIVERTSVCIDHGSVRRVIAKRSGDENAHG